MFEESFATYRDRPAIVCMDKTHDLTARSTPPRAHFAAWLQDRGLKRGARVAVMLPNVLQYPVAVAAIMRGGFTAVNVNPLYKPRELEFQLSDAGAEAIVVLENFADVLEEALPQTPVKHVDHRQPRRPAGRGEGHDGQSRGAAREEDGAAAQHARSGEVHRRARRRTQACLYARPTFRPDDVAFLQYTGGTTGIAKGATLLHRNLVANLLQVDAWHDTDAGDAAADRRARHPHRAAALSHLRADRVPAARRAQRWQNAC